ncbi:MAG: hypothetical protein HQK56_09760, partial [Deltaproteobacteria bacterium]|nr:hypothetical protein [Deltaproteobacteria bacterium]
PLQYAAAATMTMAEWRLSDRVNDSGRMRWRILQRLYADKFHLASDQLAGWRFPLNEMHTILSSQEERESLARHSTMAAVDILEYVAEPTAFATALFFSHAAVLLGLEECEQDMRSLGWNLGSAVYLLDALADFQLDLR